MTRVDRLIPGDLVTNGGMSATYVQQTVHPIWPRLRLVIWRTDNGQWSLDALAAAQDVGEVPTALDSERQERLRKALLGEVTGRTNAQYRTNIVKPFCPCDTDRPQDCKPEEWGEAHEEPACLDCGKKRYAHFGAHLLCHRPASWGPS